MANRGGLSGTKKAAKGSRRSVSLFLFALFGLLIVATGVVSRRVFGRTQSQAIRAKELQRDALDADRVTLETEIRDASSRARL